MLIDPAPAPAGDQAASPRRDAGRVVGPAIALARRALRRTAPVVLLLLALLAAWQGLVSAGAVDELVLPAPLEVAGALRADRALLLDEAAVTLSEVVLGLALALAGGTAIAVLMHLARPLREAAYPVLVASQAVPVVVIAPLLVLAFDYGTGPTVAIVALTCFFPLAVNALDGLRSAEPELLRLLRSLGSSRLGLLRRVELPGAVPHLFSGARIAASVAVIGAVFGEWAGAEAGLGRLVLLGVNQLETERVYAAVIVLTAMAIALFATVSLVERLTSPWSRPARHRP